MAARQELGRRPKVPQICAVIRVAREEAGLSTHQMAERLGVGQSQVSRWETTSEPSLSVVGAIERAFGLPRGELLRAAGYVDGIVSVNYALGIDPALDARARKVLAATYRALANGRR